jgi:putative two-component system response regulator
MTPDNNKSVKNDNIYLEAMTDRKTVLLVDDNPTNLAAGKSILKDYFKVFPIPTAEIMFDLLENFTPDLILLDIEMPEMDGYQAMRKLKESEDTSAIPVIFLTALSDENSELEGLSLGAVDYVNKPFSAPLLIKRIENHIELETQRKNLLQFNNNLKELVKERTDHVSRLQSAILDTMADLVEFRDENTGGHVTRTQRYMKLLLVEMLRQGVYRKESANWDIDIVMSSSQLHDVGKIAVSDMILNKPGKLDMDEFELMKSHVVEGIKIIQRIADNAGESDFLHHALLVASGHHEKWDGSGYPRSLSGADISLEGRLMAIADVYDALVSVRPYKKPFTTEAARDIIIEGSGTHFDPALVEVFSAIAKEFAETARESLLA